MSKLMELLEKAVTPVPVNTTVSVTCLGAYPGKIDPLVSADITHSLQNGVRCETFCPYRFSLASVITEEETKVIEQAELEAGRTNKVFASLATKLTLNQEICALSQEIRDRNKPETENPLRPVLCHFPAVHRSR